MTTPIELLLIEDNPGDIALVQEACAESTRSYNIVAKTDGEEALAYLADCVTSPEKGSYPDLVILDLNLPGLSGREILERIRQNPATSSLPIIVMTSSRSPADIESAYRLHANCYVVKPLDFGALIEVIRQIESFWFQTALRPPKPDVGAGAESRHAGAADRRSR